MWQYIFHFLRISIIGLALAYLATHYLLEPVSPLAKSASLYVLAFAGMYAVFSNKIKRLSR